MDIYFLRSEVLSLEEDISLLRRDLFNTILPVHSASTLGSFWADKLEDAIKKTCQE